LEGQACEALLCQQYWFEGELDDPCNVVFIKTAGIWSRLYFDHGIVFWRTAKRPPAPFSDSASAFRIIDYGKDLEVIGVRIEKVRIARANSESAVSLFFANGAFIEFFGADNDSSRVSLSAA
jgi:hypothetical protein